MPFEIVRNDIVNMQVDVVVNTANPNLMILATPGQHSCNTRTTVPTTSGQAFLKHADIHS